MHETSVSLTALFITEDSNLWFSAYHLGWGYTAFEIPREVARAKLGATDTSGVHLKQMFERESDRISRAVTNRGFAADGKRVPLCPTDF
ncbi:hypothetical protein [Burkholderia sp. Ac-20353]|uniref:hypothetical protein n=1 Tax=Burkholderia sp. Ac-20353 TaxID=2703894 RepID=UPI00197C673C|nr:hypothetical protein [Burkholderia sp. Ac-20353]MBN3789242.1 hypothetical protein [Burkholderia sp. Ac-20353]